MKARSVLTRWRQASQQPREPAGQASGAELTPHFEGRDVIILPDNDDAGSAYAGKVIEALKELQSLWRSVSCLTCR